MATRKTAQQRPAPTETPTRTRSSAATKRTTTATKRTTTPEKRTTAAAEKQTTAAAKRTTTPRKTTRSQPADDNAPKAVAPASTSSAATPVQPVPSVNSEARPTSKPTDNRSAVVAKPPRTPEQKLQKRLDRYAEELKVLKRQVKVSKAKLADLGKDLTKIKKDRKRIKTQRRR